jgi:hypothetical protein
MRGPGICRGLSFGQFVERLMGIGPTYLPWEGSALPLSYSRIGELPGRLADEGELG